MIRPARAALCVTLCLVMGSAAAAAEPPRQVDYLYVDYLYINASEGSASDRERAMALGAGAFLRKPFAPEELLAAAQELLAV